MIIEKKKVTSEWMMTFFIDMGNLNLSPVPKAVLGTGDKDIK